MAPSGSYLLQRLEEKRAFRKTRMGHLQLRRVYYHIVYGHYVYVYHAVGIAAVRVAVGCGTDTPLYAAQRGMHLGRSLLGCKHNADIQELVAALKALRLALYGVAHLYIAVRIDYSGHRFRQIQPLIAQIASYVDYYIHCRCVGKQGSRATVTLTGTRLPLDY